MPFYSLLIAIISVGKLAVRLAPFKVMSFILKQILRILFVLVFNNLNMMCLHVFFVLLYLEFSELCEHEVSSVLETKVLAIVSLDICFCLFFFLLQRQQLCFNPFVLLPFFFPSLWFTLDIFTDFPSSLLMVSSYPNEFLIFIEFRIPCIILFSTRISIWFILCIIIIWWNSILFHLFSSSFFLFSWTD